MPQFARHLTRLAGLALALAAASALGQETPPDSSSPGLPLNPEVTMVPLEKGEIAGLLRVLGMDRSLESLRWITDSQLVAAFGPNLGKSDPVAVHIKEAFAPERIRTDLLARIRVPQQSEKGERLVQSFLQSTLAKQASAAEDPGKGSRTDVELTAYGEKLESKRIAPAQVDAFGQLDALERRTHRNTLLLAAPAGALMRGLQAALREPPSADGLIDRTQDIGRDRAKSVHQRTVVELFETYDGKMTVEEVFGFNEELKKPRYQEFVLAMQTALSEALMAASEDFVSRMFTWAEEQGSAPAGKQALSEGDSFGKGKPAGACVDESLQRDTRCGDLGCNLRQGIFLSSCLSASGVTGICSGAPLGFDHAVTQAWATDRCNERSRRDSSCRSQFERVQVFCRTQLAGPSDLDRSVGEP